ncbi:hypothetical protein [Microbacterium sp. CJ77]|uniref:hypothetical protein n=1 Tax=Microbacterium sp. CJ77 TaxID=2079201 RepID=UPI000CD8B7A8|nr:hypothetical protein [Microbacterium sp. CJ77]
MASPDKNTAVQSVVGYFQRHWVMVLYCVVAALLAVPASCSALFGHQWSPVVTVLATITPLATASAFVWSATGRTLSLSLSVFWLWAFLFLGLAPAYQIGGTSFPWHGEFTPSEIATAQAIVLIGCVAVAVASVAVNRLRPAIVANRSRRAPGGKSSLIARRRPRSVNLFEYVLATYTLAATVFAVFVGSALFTGKTLFQQRVVALADIVGFGTLYFVATAGAICIPAIGWALRRSTMKVRPVLLYAATGVGFVVTNPLIGSRFLSGAFVIAIAGAILAGSLWQRFMPLGILVAFVTVFPSLDLARGDGTGSNKLELFLPQYSLTGFDFDAFEMLCRAVSIDDPLPSHETSRWELFVAPLLRWIPVLARDVQGHGTGPLVARETGMSFTNVSMPLWGESYFVGGVGLTVITFLALGALFGIIREGLASTGSTPLTREPNFGVLVDAPVAALLFIVLRGSLYEVLGYLLLAIAVGLVTRFLLLPKSSPPLPLPSPVQGANRS